MSRLRAPALIALALVVLTALAYLRLFENDFVNYDDDFYITGNPELSLGLSRAGFTWAFTSFHGANWFPLTRLSWMLEVQLFGLDPRVMHATNLLLHVAATLLLFTFFARSTRELWLAAFVAAVFAVHPLHVESVAWASSRKDVLSGVFFALTLVAYERYARPAGSRLAYAAVFLSLALGLMSKPVLVTTPCVLLLLDVWPLRRAERGSWARLVAEKLPLFALVGAASLVTYMAQNAWGAVESLEQLPIGDRVSNALIAYVRYLAKAFWPVGLSVYYPYAKELLRLGPALAASALLTVLSLLALRSRPVAVGWLWFLGMLVPVIGLVQVGVAAMADRYSYLPLIGLALAVASGASALVARGRLPRRVVAVAGLLVVAVLAALTHAHVRNWKDTQHLFEHALRVTEKNHVAHINIGTTYFNDERFDEAAQHLTEGLRIAPASWAAHGVLGSIRLHQDRPADAVRHYRLALANIHERLIRWEWQAGLGDAYADLGRTGAAADSYEKALRAAPESAEVHRNLARVRLERGQTAAAIASAREALRLDPELAEAHGYLGVALASRGDTRAAIAPLERAVELDPSLAAMHAHLGRALAMTGEPSRASEHFDQAVRLEPENGPFYTLRSRVRLSDGDDAGAIADLRRALALGDDSPTVMNDLAWLLATRSDPQLRSPDEALQLAQSVARAKPDDPAVLDTLGAAQFAAGQLSDAVATAERAIALAVAGGRSELAAEIRLRLADYRERERAARR